MVQKKILEQIVEHKISLIPPLKAKLVYIIFKNSVLITKKTQNFTITESKFLMKQRKK
jgi:hypothetical protein